MEGDALVTIQILMGGRRYEPLFFSARIREEEHPELIGVLISQGSKQDGIQHTEDRGVRAYAERKREDRNKAKAGILKQHSRAETNVLEHVVLSRV
jgi:hypothetical protein